MPLWKKTTTICAAILLSAPFASDSLAQQQSPLTPLPLPSLSVSQIVDAQKSIFEVGVPPSLVQRSTKISKPLKPLAAPGSPIVKLAERPTFKPSPVSNPVVPKPSLSANELKQGNPLTPLPTEVAAPAKTPVAAVPLLAARPDLKMSQRSSHSNQEVATSKTAVGLRNDFPLAAATPSIVVRSPFVQPGNPNRYLFVIENIGTEDAATTRVDLRVPAGVVLKQVVADSASSTARHAIIRIDQLKAGAKSIMEVEIQPTDVDVTFETNLTLETKSSFHGATLPKTSVAAKPAATPVASASNVTTQASYQGTRSSSTSPVIAGNANLSASLEGPVMLTGGESGNFSIVVKNPNHAPASGIVVQLEMPRGIKITTLDREAWINDEDQTISWELPSLAAGQEAVIQYKAVGKSYGQQLQKVRLGMNEVYQGDAKLVTLVAQ